MASDFFERLNEKNDFIGIAHYYFQRLLIESVELIVG